MQLCARLSDELGADIPPRLLLDAPSLDEFGIRLAQLPACGRPAREPTPPCNAAELALSYSQERMCFMHELSLGSAAYHVPMAIHLRGTLDTAALRAAFGVVVARHDVLHTAIAIEGGRLALRFGAAATPELIETSLQPVRESQRQQALDDYLSEFANGPFQLDRGPLLRAALIHLGANDAVFVIVLHHVAADQWALDVFLRELAACYRAALAGQPPPLPPSGSLARFCAASRRRFEAERQETETSYWLAKLRGLEPTVLNEDFVRPAQQSFAGAKLRLDFPLRDILALRAFGAAQGATLAMVLLAALNVLLMRHTGRKDVAVGVPIANRQDPESWNLMGTLVNTLVLRAELDPGADFRAALATVREAMLEAFEYQDLPFERLVRQLHLERDTSRPALFTVMFNMLNTPLGRVEFPGLAWSRREFDRHAAQFDLTVTVDAEHARSISFEYSTALFSAPTVRRLAEHYIELLHAVVRDATRPLGLVELIPAAEYRQLHDWSHGPRRPRVQGTIDALIWPAFAAHADAPALLCGGQSLSYAELGRAADGIARGLARLGAGRGTLVGLHLQRSPWMLAAMLGVLRSGAAYVPLDPDYPADRLVYMARDAGLELLITDGPESAPAVAWPEVCRSVTFTELLTPGPDAREASVGAQAHPGDPAYVIYTSGSTGEPKGVAVPHAAVVNFLRSMQEQPELTSGDRLLAITTLSFDIAVLELLLPLLVGACVVLARREEQTDGETLGALLDRHRITVMQATPSTWRLLIESGWAGSGELRALVGGETLTRELASELQVRCAEVWNMYGPTETTVWSSCGRVEPPGRDRISLGQPIANTEIVVLDRQRGICPIGVPGEICIGGDGLAIGYLNRPEFTAARFITNPHSRDRRTKRLYLTGDRGRWRTDGRLEHLGRLDSQVKIRGYRIEPGEVESRLASHPDVSAAVVLARVHGSGAVLIAYVVFGRRAAGARELREYLRRWLPDYMVPQYFIALPALPRLPNGKLDRQALPPPRVEDALHEAFAPPRDPTEEALWQIWSQVLRSDRFGIYDNLFDIGGHSLLAVQIVNRIRVDLQRHCSLSLVLRYPTIAALAAALGGGADQPGFTVVPLQPHGTGPELFCLCGISIYRELADALAPAVPVCAVFVAEEMAIFGGSTQGTAFTDVPTLARAYLAAIRARQPAGPYRLLGFSFGGVVAFEIAQQLRARGETVALLAILDSDVPGVSNPGAGAVAKRIGQSLLASLRRMFRPDIAGGTGGADAAALDRPRYLATMRRYEPQPYHGITFYAKSLEKPAYDSGYGWTQLLPAVQSVVIEDSHLGILRGGSVKRLATELRRRIESTDRP